MVEEKGGRTKEGNVKGESFPDSFECCNAMENWGIAREESGCPGVFQLRNTYAWGTRETEAERPQGPPVPCNCLALGIYSIFALKRVALRGGRKPTFLLPPVAVGTRPA